MSISGSWPALALALVIFLLVMVGVGMLTGRLLGVQRGIWRSVMAGAVGFAVFLALVSWRPEASLPEGLEWVIVFVVMILATMATSVLLGSLAKPGHTHGGRSPRVLVRNVRGYVQSVGRLVEIARYARSRGLLVTPVTTPAGARALRKTLEDAGGMLVKFGQIASTRDDLLPPAVIEELSLLRSSAPGLPQDVVRERVESELGAPIEVLFASFDPQPLAAASIGVAHRATLHDGRRVIVKVQRPGIEDVVDRDARVLDWGARRLEARSQSLSRLKVTDLTTELIASVRLELDFTREQASNAAMRTNRETDPGIRFPEVLPELTTRRVLVMEEVNGPPVSEAAALEHVGRPRSVMADNLFASFLKQTLIDGLFHADPHPGNILVDADGQLWFIDYGAIGVVDPITLEALQLLSVGFLRRDAGTMARAVRRMVGTQGTRLDIAAVETDMAGILSRFAGGSGFDPAILSEVALGLARYDVAAPKALTVLGRAGITLQGTLSIIDPTFSMGPRSQPIIASLAAQQVTDDPQELLMGEVEKALPSLRSLPQLAEDLGLQTRAGRLTIRSERFATADKGIVDAWIDRILFVVIGVVGVVTSVLLLAAGVFAEGSGVSVYLYALGFSGLFLAGAMLLRALAQMQRRARSGQA